jgi:hypothetical protein
MNEQTVKIYDFFQQQGFLPINQESYPIFKSYEQYSVLQEMGETIITTWSFSQQGLYKIIHGYLCSVYYMDEPVGFAIHRPPLEKREYSLGQIIDILYGMARKVGLPALRVKFIEERFLKEYEAIEGYHIQNEYSDDHSEYAYRIRDLLELSGRINFNKRNRLKKFLKQDSISLQPITKENVHICLEVQEAWCGHRECSFCESFTGCEKKVVASMVAIFDEQVHTGIIGYFDSTPVGYAIGEKKNEQLAFLYFGKSTVPNFFLYLIYMLVKTYFSDVAYLNINEDMGNTGLRVFKAELSIHELWRKYACTFTKVVEGVSGDGSTE